MTGHIVITGAAGGIGAALSRHFLMLGHKVTGIDRAEFSTEMTVLPGFKACLADITNEDQIEAAMETAASIGPISAVIANAAITDPDNHQTIDMPIQRWQNILRVNVDGAFLTARSAARRMAKTGGGNISFVTSSLALLSDAKAGTGPYCTSKAAVEMLSRVMALEFQPLGINVNTLYPSAIIDTGFFADRDDAFRATLSPPTILNETAVFLASLTPGAATGRSLDHEAWEHDPEYRHTWGVKA